MLILEANLWASADDSLTGSQLNAGEYTPIVYRQRQLIDIRGLALV